ncbi:MAG: ABC-type transport auxiliary lipoprotein family protein [Rhodanobacteraceae bacterium]
MTDMHQHAVMKGIINILPSVSRHAAIRHSIVFMLLGCLGACSAITGKQTPYAIYSPSLAATQRSTGNAVAWQLAVETPRASDALDGNRIAVMPTPGEFQVFPAARWRDPAPKLVQGLLIQAFEDDGRVIGVSTAAAGLHADFTLALELRSFEIDYVDGNPHAVVQLTAKLVDYTSNRVLAVHAFAADVPVGGRGAGDAASGIGQALNQILPKVVAWTLAQGNSAWARHAPDSAPQPSDIP